MIRISVTGFLPGMWWKIGTQKIFEEVGAIFNYEPVVLKSLV